MGPFFLFVMISLLVSNPDDDAKKNRRMKNRVEVREYRNVIEEVTYHDRWKKVATVRMYDKAHQRLSEEHYNDFQLGIRHGQTRCWYPNGQLHWTCDFKQNEINGPFFSYYEDGALKRRELYRRGTVRKGECFSPDGTLVSCQPLSQKAEFEGGPKKFIAFLKTRLEHLQPENPALFFTLRATLSPDGILFGLQTLPYMEQRPEPERRFAKQVVENLRDMPRWKPVVFDDQTVQSDLVINIFFSNGKVYSGSYGLNF
ncbi:toxin-antitoxin system YwqK family antitoxin [Larkinella rosea]|uniref:TonB C-terminal domain-containing protein n=1 Tax=Larkinella rosea TaxID=2025312 RepID=A0A3P1C2S2_9BACT|nr:hypothetical protein [Larkinella rosea]RRB07572.1 hypothetical protein EHT25_07280 [Larkinella rosea]